MASKLIERTLVGRSEGMPTGKGCSFGEAVAEWRSSEQVENEIVSTSSSCYGSDDTDEDGGLKPSELYGKYTWRIRNFSKITKRDFRSNAFEIGGYKWCISIYPQGCEVSNHLSLFLCVANHEKLLPGWSHLAQFTIAVVNKDPQKSKYSDTVHRFRHKEHDWGWKKFIELSKLSDGFVDAKSDILTIRAQIQVIREKADRPFRCLQCQYRSELVRVYLTTVVGLCRKFIEENRMQLGKLLEDKARRSSFCTFWLGIDQSSRRHMSNEKMDLILREIVKQFVIGKEATSTLVMDSLYSGLRALEGRNKSENVKGELLDGGGTPPPIIRVEKDMFVLVDDALMLLERAVSERFPPKDENGPQNRLKDGSTEEDFSKESSEYNGRLLTNLGRRMIEMFVLAYIISNKIEVAYRYDVALKMQEELIREEEKAGVAMSEQKAKHVSAKEKKGRKRMEKQKRNGRKGKDKPSCRKGSAMVQDKQPCENAIDEETGLDMGEIPEDEYDISSSVDDAANMYHVDSDDRHASIVDLDSETSEIHPCVTADCEDIVGSISTIANGIDKGSSSVMDDGSSTTSTDSIPSVSTNGSPRGKPLRNAKGQNSPIRVENLYSKVPSKESSVTREADDDPSETARQRHHNDVCPDGPDIKMTDPEKPVSGCLPSSIDGTPDAYKHKFKKEDETAFLQKKRSNVVQVDTKGVSIEKASVKLYCPRSSSRRSGCSPRLKSETRDNPAMDLMLSTKAPTSNSQLTEKATSSTLTEKTASSSQLCIEKTASSSIHRLEKKDTYCTQETEKAASATTQQTQEAVSSSAQQTAKAPLLTNMPQSSSWSRSGSMKANGLKPLEKNFGQRPSASTQQTEKAIPSSSQKIEKVPLSTNMPQSSSLLGSDSVKANCLKPPEKHFRQPPSASNLQTEKAMPFGSQKIVPLSTIMAHSSTWSAPDAVKANGQLSSYISSASSVLNAPPVPGSKPRMAPTISIVQTESTKPRFSHSLSEAARAGPDPRGSYAYVPQFHRSAITGTSAVAAPHPYPVSSAVNPSLRFFQQTTMVSAPMLLTRGSDGIDSGYVSLGTSFGLATRDIAHTGHYSMSSQQQHISQSMMFDSSSNLNGLNNFDLQKPSNGGSHVPVVPSDVSVSTSDRHIQGVSAEEFPHLHIITDLLDDEQQGSTYTYETGVFRGMSSLPNLFNQQLNVSGDLGISEDVASLASSSPFARSSGYYDGFRQDYSSCGPYDSFQEFMPDSHGPLDYWNSMQVPVGGSEFSSINVWSSVNDEYSNYVNGYSNPSMFRYSNGY